MDWLGVINHFPPACLQSILSVKIEVHIEFLANYIMQLNVSNLDVGILLPGSLPPKVILFNELFGTQFISLSAC